jgi:sister-chromatid-cohesion protein PDS5
MLDAIHPLREALVMPKLLRHQDGGVSLMVATCISEITTISATDAPYEDDVMRDAFQLIISTFRGLGDIHSPLFGRRVTLLETMAKIKSCVVMWDIGCHDLILEMFHIFFSVVSEAHPRNVIILNAINYDTYVGRE